ncbi:MAG: hypothetical protein CMG00_04430 [Candidatus Marinimicrobia bacterium]|nr:hypothetical protein [Candidatus Neomarinimicrobiota bacterium]
MKNMFASIAGTKRFALRAQKNNLKSFYNLSQDGLYLSSVGMGLYKGENSAKGDEEWYESLSYGLKKGINVFDTSIRYRSMRSEKILGKVIKDAINDKKIKRDEIFISTKGGLISFPDKKDKKKYVESELVKKRNINLKEIFNYTHCINLKFIEEELDQSLENLGLEGIDTYLIHNIEFVFMLYEKKKAYDKIELLFDFFEKAVRNKKILSYGISSWAGFRRKQNSQIYVEIRNILNAAKNVGGKNHNLKFIEAPLSVGMPYIAQKKGNKKSILELIKNNKLDLLASAPLYEGHIERLINLDTLFRKAGKSESLNNTGKANISLPVSENSIIQLFELLIASRNNKSSINEKLNILNKNNSKNNYISALNLVRSTDGITSALTGMDRLEYAKKNLKIMNEKKIKMKVANNFWNSLSINE